MLLDLTRLVFPLLIPNALLNPSILHIRLGGFLQINEFGVLKEILISCGAYTA